MKFLIKQWLHEENKWLCKISTTGNVKSKPIWKELTADEKDIGYRDKVMKQSKVR